MMRNSFSSILIALALAACARGTAARLDEPLQLAPGEWASFAGERLEVQFVGIDADSRCPGDVTCVWAGEVVVRLALRRDSRNKEVAIKEAQGIAVDGYNLSVLQVLPQRVSSSPVPASDYRVTLKITR